MTNTHRRRTLRGALVAALLTAVATPALAACPAKAPKMKWNIHSGDQRVNAAYLQGLLPGKKVEYRGYGTEVYGADGSYSYVMKGETHKAPAYRFYADGTRCIDYPTPRFDLYVVNDRTLILVNVHGFRGEGILRR